METIEISGASQMVLSVIKNRVSVTTDDDTGDNTVIYLTKSKCDELIEKLKKVSEKISY